MSSQCSKKAFSIQTGRTRIAFSWASLIGFILISALFLSLGTWQIERYETQKHNAKLWIDNQHKPPLIVDSANTIDVQHNHRRVSITGTFVANRNAFIDNTMHHHQPGYQVISPLKIHPNDTQWVLVNRGWIPYRSESHRMLIPKIPTIVGPQTIEGQIYCPTKTPFLLNKRQWLSTTKGSYPIVAQTLDLPKIAHALQQNISACYVQLDGPKSLTFVHEWHKTPITPYRHLGYAFQWYLFTGIFWIIFYLKHRQ